MDDIADRYARMVEQVAALYANDGPIHAQLSSLRVTREEWDSDRRGGHFWFEVSAPAAVDHDFLVEAQAEDSDGAIVEIILHSVDGILKWGEWFRWPLTLNDVAQAICQWPPLSVGPK